MSLSELGIYSLFFTIITLSYILIGYDYYTYSTREILTKDYRSKALMVRDQFIFHLLTYVIVLPLLYSIFLFNIIPQSYLFLFYTILVCEHLSQECFRLFTTLSKPLIANLIFFIKSSSWVYIILLISGLGLFDLTLKHILIMWNVGVFLSVLVSLFYIKTLHLGAINKPVNWKWIKRGIVISTPFFISTIAQKVIEFSNRFFIDQYLTKDAVGIYAFYSNIANSMLTITYTAVIMIIYPKLIEYYDKDIAIYKEYEKKLWVYTFISSIIYIGVIFIIISPLLSFLGEKDLSEHISILWILLPGTAIYMLSFVPHYNLYVKHKDILIMSLTITGAVFNFIFNFFFIKRYGLYGAPLALSFTYMLIFSLKYYYSRVT